MLAHPSFILSAFIFFDMKLCAIIHRVLAGKSTGWLWIGGLRAVLVLCGQLDALLIHTLSLHPLD